jgi:hypothetical protein
MAVPSSQVTASFRLEATPSNVQMTQQKMGRNLQINLQQEEMGQQPISFSKQGNRQGMTDLD